jgi:RNA polymerase sigma factor (sigma-70 family)
VAAGEAGPVSGGGTTVAGGDQHEFGAYYLREMPRLVLFVKTLSGDLDWHAANDVAQTAFERALPRWTGLSQPKAWLYKVARNEAIARCAAMRRELPADVLPERVDEVSGALAAEWRAEQRAVMELLQGLPPKQREVMTWTLAGFNDAENAAALGLSTDAVKQNRHYARQKLRKRLGPRKEDSR